MSKCCLTLSSRPNYSSATAPQPVSVTLPAFRNVYVYSALKLWAAYGVAVFLAGLAVFLGLVTICLNGVSYSSTFSTVFRVARGADVSVELQEEDLDGRDPLPKHLAKAQVSFGEIKFYERENVRSRSK